MATLPEDTILSLVSELKQHGSPSTGWIAKHAPFGDPLPKAWITCKKPVPMVQLLLQLAPSQLQTALHSYTNQQGDGVVGAMIWLVVEVCSLLESGNNDAAIGRLEQYIACCAEPYRPTVEEKIAMSLVQYVPTIHLADVCRPGDFRSQAQS